MFRCYSIHTVTYKKAWMKSFSSFNLGVWACVCTSVYFFLKCGHTHLTDWPACVHNASTPVDVNAVLLVGFFFLLILCHFFSSSFCVFFFCEDANVTHKVSIVKKKKIHCWVCLQYSFWYVLLSPHVMENRQRSKFGVELGVICKWRRTVIVVKLEKSLKIKQYVIEACWKVFTLFCYWPLVTCYIYY